MFEISVMPDFPYKNAWGTLSLGVEEIALCCVFYINYYQPKFWSVCIYLWGIFLSKAIRVSL